MTDQSCPVLTPAERQVADIVEHAERAMLAKIYKALEDAGKHAAAELQSIGHQDEPPADGYFLAVAHQKLFLRLCGADPETFEGGDPKLAAFVLENGRKIAAHYWEGVAMESLTGPSAPNG